jgi:hypothetical protein
LYESGCTSLKISRYWEALIAAITISKIWAATIQKNSPVEDANTALTAMSILYGGDYCYSN